MRSNATSSFVLILLKDGEAPHVIHDAARLVMPLSTCAGFSFGTALKCIGLGVIHCVHLLRRDEDLEESELDVSESCCGLDWTLFRKIRDIEAACSRV